MEEISEHQDPANGVYRVRFIFALRLFNEEKGLQQNPLGLSLSWLQS